MNTLTDFNQRPHVKDARLAGCCADEVTPAAVSTEQSSPSGLEEAAQAGAASGFVLCRRAADCAGSETMQVAGGARYTMPLI